MAAWTGPGEELAVVVLELELDLDHDAEDGLAVDQKDDEIGAVVRRHDIGKLGGLDACLGVRWQRDVECVAQRKGDAAASDEANAAMPSAAELLDALAAEDDESDA